MSIFGDLKQTLMGIRAKIGEPLEGNYTEIENTGFQELHGDARYWTDRSSASTRVRIGALNKPDFDYTNIGLLFPQDNPDEKVYILDQMLHSKALGTPLKLHIHYIQDEVTRPTFKVDYRFYNNGELVPDWITLSTDDAGGPVFPYPGSGSLLQIIPFPEIPAAEGEDVSANLEMIVYRDDNVVTGDVLVKYIDYHFQSDTGGSRKEFIK